MIQSSTGRPGRGETALASNSGPPLRPERSLRSPARLRTASPTGRPGQNTTSDLHLQPGICQTPAYELLSNWHSQCRLGPTDRGRPLGRDQETDGESKARRTSQTTILGTVHCAPVRQYPATLLARQSPSSVVGADIFPYGVVGAINSHTRQKR